MPDKQSRKLVIELDVKKTRESITNQLKQGLAKHKVEKNILIKLPDAAAQPLTPNQ